MEECNNAKWDFNNYNGMWDIEVCHFKLICQSTVDVALHFNLFIFSVCALLQKQSGELTYSGRNKDWFLAFN